MKRIFAVIILSWIAAPLHAATYTEAVELFKKGSYQESLQMCADLLDAEQDMVKGSPNYDIRFLAAHNHMKLGNRKSAISHLRRCMDIRPDTVDPYVDLALYLADRGDAEDATSIARKGLKIEETPLLYYALARTSMKQGNYWRAKALLEKANALKGDYHFIYNDLGVVLMKLKKYPEATTSFSAALALSPNSEEIMLNLAQSLEQNNELSRALSQYRMLFARSEKYANQLENKIKDLEEKIKQ